MEHDLKTINYVIVEFSPVKSWKSARIAKVCNIKNRNISKVFPISKFSMFQMTQVYIIALEWFAKRWWLPAKNDRLVVTV